MINSLPPAIFPTSVPANNQNEQLPAEKAGGNAASVSITSRTTSQSQEIRSHESHDSHRTRHGRHDHDDHSGHGKSGRSERSELFKSAKHMIKDAFKDFRHDIRDSFRDLGFDGKLARNIAKGVMHASKDALRAGVDFSAKLMVATISQTRSVSESGISSSFNMVANSIEVSINHATGAIDVNTSSVSIEAQFNQSLGGTQPHLLDIHVSGSGASNNLTDALLAPKDIDAILDGADDPAEEAPPPPLVIPTVVTTARQQIDLTLGQTAKDGTIEETTIRTAVESVLESAATDDVVPVEESDETEAKDVSEEESEEVSKPELDLPEIVTPLLLNRPEYSARIFITAYEHQVNDRSERITFMRFDAVIPLSTPPVAEPDVPAPVIPTTDAPVADTTEEEPESKVA